MQTRFRRFAVLYSAALYGGLIDERLGKFKMSMSQLPVSYQSESAEYGGLRERVCSRPNVLYITRCL